MNRINRDIKRSSLTFLISRQKTGHRSECRVRGNRFSAIVPNTDNYVVPKHVILRVPRSPEIVVNRLRAPRCTAEKSLESGARKSMLLVAVRLDILSAACRQAQTRTGRTIYAYEYRVMPKTIICKLMAIDVCAIIIIQNVIKTRVPGAQLPQHTLTHASIGGPGPRACVR